MTLNMTIVPTEEQAQSAYRAAWTAYVLAVTDEARVAAGEMMDHMQPYIADNPKDPRWPAFTATLPGFAEFWANWGASIRFQLRTIFK